MFMSDISIIVRRMRTFAERAFASGGLGFPEQLVIMHLAAYGSSNQETIAASLDIDRGAITKTVGKLEAKGLVVREVNSANRREKIITLTDQAQPIIEQMKVIYEDLQGILFKGFEEEEVETLTANLSKVASNLSEEINQEKE